MQVSDSLRLSYSPITDSDAELLYQLDQDPEVMRYINDGKASTMQDIHRVFLPRLKKYDNREKGWGLWKVTVTESGEFIGWVLVRPMDFFSDNPQWDNIELGWRFLRRSWGKGYATEAAQSVKQALLKLGYVKSLSAIALEDNEASINIMKKLGMTYLKTDIHKDPLGDCEVVFYQMKT